MRGKFLFAEGEKLLVRGVTYGPFRPDRSGSVYPSAAQAERDFSQMAAHGINAVRTYTLPPIWLLDAGARHGIRMMIGLSWEDHVAFLENRSLPADVIRRVRHDVRGCAGHPAVLCYTLANEIPASIVRWHGAGRIERFLRELSEAVRAEDPCGLFTYVNYPSTEYLHLPFIDLVAFNVYLEQREPLSRYINRLQNLAGERPLLLAEMGLDSRRHGMHGQAEALDWQTRTALEAGCCGLFVFAWTDEWHRGGDDIEDWDFGLVTRERQPKPALPVVHDAFAAGPFGSVERWPSMSVIVCSYNGARTIRETLAQLSRLDYPDYEVIVVDDGSTDATAEIAGGFPVRLIRTENQGLSAARNTGLLAAGGEIVAYIDDDAHPDPHWLRYLALKFLRSTHVGIGGPNLANPGDGSVADCVDNAPGNPTHILVDDDVAEHIPGCNMAFRRSALVAVGGFDPRFRATADDVDLCWRLQERGWTIGFSPAAVVWHHRRATVRAYLRQQFGYGWGEFLLEQKWPARHSAVGHVSWSGRIYGRGITVPLRLRPWSVYHGIWGTAPFQSVYERAPNAWSALPLLPEWYLLLALLTGLALLRPLWAPLGLFVVLATGAFAASVAQAVLSARRAVFHHPPPSRFADLRLRALVAALHLLQPLARLLGRMRNGLTPWRTRGRNVFAAPKARRFAFWQRTWRSGDDRLRALQRQLEADGAIVRPGSAYDRWDLEVRGGLCGSVNGLMAIEEHGAGRQLVRFRLWPRVPGMVLMLTGLLAGLAIAALSVAPSAAFLLSILAVSLAVRAALDCAVATGAWLKALEGLRQG